jgi:hypothetical protein
MYLVDGGTGWSLEQGQERSCEQLCEQMAASSEANFQVIAEQ